MNTHGIANFIKENYPEYWGVQTYPIEQCCPIRKVTEQWGILSNFGRTPLVVDSITFKNSEQLFQLMKFQDAEPVKDIYAAPAGLVLKHKVKHWESTRRRSDWPTMIVDAMKYVLTVKYQQSEEFRSVLKRTAGCYIVEDQTARKRGKPADGWGVVDDGKGGYVGPNLLGRLLMELRDNAGQLEYNLPDDALEFLTFLRT